jgi:hypothetical protein
MSLVASIPEMGMIFMSMMTTSGRLFFTISIDFSEVSLQMASTENLGSELINSAHISAIKL